MQGLRVWGQYPPPSGEKGRSRGLGRVTQKEGSGGGNYSLIDAPALPAMLSSIFSKQQTPQEEQKAFSFNIMNNRLKLVVKIVQNTNWNRMHLFEAVIVN